MRFNSPKIRVLLFGMIIAFVIVSGCTYLNIPSVTSDNSGATCGVRNEGTICKQKGGHDLCVNLNVSNTHCGSCFNSCSSTGACVSGQCRTTTCPQGEVDALGSCIRMDFPEIATIHCGGFGLQCPPGNRCFEGVCEPLTCPSPTHICAGYFCCPADTDNPCYGVQGSEWCKDGCKNFQTDTENCGGCGKECGSGRKCCSGKCVNIQTDAGNCGSCNTTCWKTCSNGKCDPKFEVIDPLNQYKVGP